MLNTEQRVQWGLGLCVFNKGAAYFHGLKMDIFHILIYKIDKICELTLKLFSLSPISV